MHLSRGKCVFNEFFIYFYNMAYTMDILTFLERKRMSQATLSRELGTTPGNVNRWVKGEGVPSWEICRKLLLLGMTVEELFGVEYSKMHIVEGGSISLTDEDLSKAFLRAAEVLGKKKEATDK